MIVSAMVGGIYASQLPNGVLTVPTTVRTAGVVPLFHTRREAYPSASVGHIFFDATIECDLTQETKGSFVLRSADSDWLIPSLHGC